METLLALQATVTARSETWLQPSLNINLLINNGDSSHAKTVFLTFFHLLRETSLILVNKHNKNCIFFILKLHVGVEKCHLSPVEWTIDLH